MSAENVKAFFEKAEGDKALQEKLKALAEQEEAREAGDEELVKIASAAGYEFTADDVAEVRKESAGELSEDELKQVAGGAGQCRSGWGDCPFCSGSSVRHHL